MDLIVLKKRRHGATRNVQLSGWMVFFGLFGGLLLAGGGGFFAGSRLAEVGGEPPVEQLNVLWQEQLSAQQQLLQEAAQDAQANLDALTLKVGQMQAQAMRLDALGQRLTKMAGLDKGEFDFESAPAQGGPEQLGALQTIAVPDFVSELNELAQRLANREQQLAVLETLLINRGVQQEVYPAGRPIDGGWISSYFGKRTDPFSGKLEHHEGIDFAGKEGSDVMAVAAGVVTWAGKRYGYGNLVEINHGNGYVTRYGHNREVLVEPGQAVKKGEVIAAMGSTGRSTGPHVHFEVLHSGRPVNPLRYVQAAK